MDSVLGSIWIVGVVAMSGGLALVGLTQEATEPVHLETRSLVWGDGHGRQVGDAVDIEHVQPEGARVLISYDGSSAEIQLERGDRLWLPCPAGDDDWITFSANGRVVEQVRVTGCTPRSMGTTDQDTSTPPDTDADGPHAPPCRGTVLPPHRMVHLRSMICIPALHHR